MVRVRGRRGGVEFTAGKGRSEVKATNWEMDNSVFDTLLHQKQKRQSSALCLNTSATSSRHGKCIAPIILPRVSNMGGVNAGSVFQENCGSRLQWILSRASSVSVVTTRG